MSSGVPVWITLSSQLKILGNDYLPVWTIEKTHNPSRQLKRIVDSKTLDEAIKPQIEELISILDRFGIEEHFMTDYGDETTRTDPWSLFNKEDAEEALAMAERGYSLAENIYMAYLKELSE